MTEADSGSNGDNGQVTNPAENPSDSGNGGGANTNPTESKATYTITFDANGGSGEMKAQTAESGSEITLAANAFTRDGWTFSGWATSAGVGVSYSDKAKITLTGDITLYATWGMTAASAVTAIADLTEEGTHTVTVAGEISSDDMTELANAISGLAENVKIILDLGDTTGLTDIPAEFDLENLAGIVIPASVTKLSCLFWNNYNLSVLKVAENNPAYKSVGNIIYTKDGQTLVLAAKNLTEVTIPSGVKTIGSWAFRQNFNLKKVSFEEGIVLETIEDNAFDSCGILTEISLPSTLESIGDFTFGNTKLSVVKYNGTKSGWDNINKGNNNNDLDNAAVICMGSDPKEVYAPADKAATVIAGLEGGTRENPNVYMIKITDKTLTAEQLKEIGTTIETVANKSNYYAFFSLDLSSATEVTEIPEEAFSTCRLRGLILPDSLETIGTGAFGYNKFEEIVIPDNVKTIEDGGFEYCSKLKTITLPASLVSIGASAFAGTVLETVYYKGPQAQWEILKTNISTTDNDKLTGAKIICSDGIINGE